ncbi:DUF4089 domain-containing protein [Paraburkholderia saeva]|uniref:DUF4089 domain-containing protein n=1 Tax=Paraburkholderia saeva TaxID=2777537 RepID=UPI001D3D4106|nr:DUF4089 domain-containing protein [Paraburkholderia saeva]CAG4898958.1 hypothetical protein R70241_02551 [Paraburkholderia saeva]
MSDDSPKTHTIDADTRTAFVEAALKLHFQTLPEGAEARVQAQFARIAMLAVPVLAFPLNADDEPAPVFRA